MAETIFSQKNSGCRFATLLRKYSTTTAILMTLAEKPLAEMTLAENLAEKPSLIALVRSTLPKILHALQTKLTLGKEMQ